MTASPPSAGGSGGGLFKRIYITFVVTVVAATLVGAAASWFLVARQSEQWVAMTLNLLETENDALAAELRDRDALNRRVSEMAKEAGTEIGVYNRKGKRIAGQGPARTPERAARLARRLEKGHPMVRPAGNGRGRRILFPISHPDTDETLALVQVRPRRSGPVLPLVLSAAGVLLLLGLGANSLSRSLRRRLGALETSAERIAAGELAHRVELPDAGPRDELDQLALGFNAMAEKVQRLIEGQRILLANVSHELRTPIARVKVQLELLEDRLVKLRVNASDEQVKHVERLESGFADMTRDNIEIEKLIADLLTSGRLELAADGANLQRSEFDLPKLLESMADRFAATVKPTEALRVDADSMLLERLLSNLLSNARRACPDGELTVELEQSSDGLRIAVEDEGPGIASEDRERVFEPFRRLDAARSRDKGGVGLGLFLCRQIARAHGGTVVALGRTDGRAGARMEIQLPASLAV